MTNDQQNPLQVCEIWIFGLPRVFPVHMWSLWLDPILFPFILPITQIALTGVRKKLTKHRILYISIKHIQTHSPIQRIVLPSTVTVTTLTDYTQKHFYVSPGSVYTVVAVALERYFNICKPFSRNLVGWDNIPLLSSFVDI